jgi:alanine racemase
LFTGDELSKAANENFTLVVHHEAQVQMLEKDSKIKPMLIWIKIDTGMHRLGFEPQQLERVYQRLLQCASVQKPIGFMTHFAQSEACDPSLTQQQIEIFNKVTAPFHGPHSLSNSGGVIAWPTAHREWVRPGLILYGASPFAACSGLDHDLRPVMSLSSELIAIHKIAKGEKVGYGGAWTCPEDMLVGVVGIGYGDGYPQFAKSGTPMLVNGHTCPLIGRVSMDMSTVDLRSQVHAKVGDPVLLWGPGLPVEIVALNNGTSAYELLTRITQRVRVVVCED